MITDTDRMGWIGASDTRYIMGKWDTETFKRFWQTKQGLIKGMFSSPEMRAGNMWESKIADAVNATNRDKQVVIEDLKLRVNLDAELNNMVCEIKTHKNKNGWKPTKAYWYQVQAEMFADKKQKAVIVAYALEDEDYLEVSEVDNSRLGFWIYDYDEIWITNEYLPRIQYLAECIKKGLYPNESKFENDKAESEGL